MYRKLFLVSNQNVHSMSYCYESQWHDEVSSSGETSVPYIRSIGQFLLSRLLSSLASSVFKSDFSWVLIFLLCLLLLFWMTSCTKDMPRSAWSVALETHNGASPIIRRILDWLLWLIDVLDFLCSPIIPGRTSK
jgi:hypothetical protein